MLRNKIGLAVALMGLASLAAAALSAQTTFNTTSTLPSNIPDGTGGAHTYGAPLDLSIPVTGIANNLTNVQIAFTISHTWAGDVEATLVAPNAASHLLFDTLRATSPTSFGTSNDFVNCALVFDDSASANIWDAAATNPVPSGTYRTVQAGISTTVAVVTSINAVFGGMTPANANGTWILRFRDGGNGDVGTISAASITLTEATPTAPTITSTAPTTAIVGVSYMYTITATGNPTPTFSVAGNPAWLTLTGNVLSGTPAVGDIGTAGPITVTATNGVSPDDTEVFSIVVSPSAPEIDVQDVDAISLTSPHAFTVYGAWAGAALNGTFVIRNIGNVGLDITAVTVSATVNCTATFVPTGTPTFTIAAAGTDNCAASVTPTAAGTFSFTVTIASNDADEPTFTINFSGTAQATNAPEIAVAYLTTNIANGSTTTQANTGVATFNRPYTFRNEGSGALTLNGTPIVAISALVNCSVVVNDPASTNIAAADWNAATEAWSLDISPTAAGPFSFTVTVANDDADENPFVFNFSGHTAAFPVIGGGGGDDDGCSTGSGSNSWMLLAGLLASLAVAIRMTRARA